MTDVLADVLTHLPVRDARCTKLVAGEEWALHFTLRAHFKFVSVLEGTAWLSVDGGTPLHLQAGDMFLLANAASYTVGSDPDLEPVDGLSAFDWEGDKVVALGGSGTTMLGGAFDLDGPTLGFLFEALPSVIHIAAGNPAARALGLSLSLLDAEVSAAALGGSVTRHRLAEILLIQALRIYSGRLGPRQAAWLTALADPRIGRVLGMMHEEPARHWTVGELAASAGMSRSSLAAHFVEKVGVPPLTYLQRWRMERARSALRSGTLPMARIAQEAGYETVSAFGATFKRQFGISPGQAASAL